MRAFKRAGGFLEWYQVVRKATRAHADLFVVELSPAVSLTEEEAAAFMVTRHVLNDIERGQRLPVLAGGASPEGDGDG